MTIACDAGVSPLGTSDAALVRRTLDGDARAFALLVDRHAPACLRYATRMLGERADAEEATQEALLRAHDALHGYDDRMAFRTWLFAILINRCRTALRQRTRRERRFVHDRDALARSTIDGDASAIDLRQDIERALAALSADQREAFLLRHVEQLGYEEIAAATGAGVSASKMRVKRACERLKLLLGNVGRADAD